MRGSIVRRPRVPITIAAALALCLAGADPGSAGPPKPPACEITGTGANDIIDGTAEDDVICAKGGDDIVRGGGGNDLIFGGAGKDTLEGGDGNDGVYGQAGDDALFGDAGNDLLSGDDGRDAIVGKGGTDKVLGGPNNDRCLVTKDSHGGDSINGGLGTDTYDKDAGDTATHVEKKAACVPPPEF